MAFVEYPRPSRRTRSGFQKFLVTCSTLGSRKVFLIVEWKYATYVDRPHGYVCNPEGGVRRCRDVTAAGCDLRDPETCSSSQTGSHRRSGNRRSTGACWMSDNILNAELGTSEVASSRTRLHARLDLKGVTRLFSILKGRGGTALLGFYFEKSRTRNTKRKKHCSALLRRQDIFGEKKSL